MSRKPTLGIDYTSRDYEAYRTLLIEKLKEKMPEYTDTSSTDAGIVILECLANGLDITSMYADIVANDLFLPTTQDRRLAVLLARQLGYVAKNQTTCTITQVFKLNSIQDEDIIIPKGTTVHTKESSDMVTVYFETMRELTIPAGNLGDELDEDGNYKYFTEVSQGATIKEDVIGYSNGQPYQTYKLSYPEVITDGLEVWVDEGDGSKPWEQVPSMLESTSGSNSNIYTVTVDEFDFCYVEFGSGLRGKIPEQGSQLIASYRIGGGTIGNVKPNTITEVQDSIAFVDSTFNPFEPTVLGHEKEGIAEIRENGSASFRVRNRAITEQDYADLVRMNFFEVFGSVGVKDENFRLNMNLYYQMRTGFSMTPAMLESIKLFFSTKIIPGTTLFVHSHEPYPIDIDARLRINRDYNQVELESFVIKYVKDTYFADGEFTFEDSLSLTDLEDKVIKTFAGVESFRVVTPTEELIKAPERYQIITLGDLTLTTTGGKVG